MQYFSNEIDQEYPFVIYKEPNSSFVKILQQKDAELYTDENLETDGFYLYPYEPTQSPAVVFPEDKLISKEVNYRKFALNSIPIDLELEETDQLKKNHQEKVNKAIEVLKTSSVLKKAIISSRFPVKINSFSWENALLKLMKIYDESFVWAWYHPEIGMWMGASPELLASYQDGEFLTMALAGTLPIKKEEPVIWSGKEIREQKLVTDFIVQNLQKQATQLKISTPKTIYQGKIAHIQTDITAEVPKNKINKLILSLHPTPAVSGMPVIEAKNLIKKIENQPRKYYTGFLGRKNKNLYKFYVNLRSMEVGDKSLTIFAGGGILENSEAKNEWNEIINKLNILYQIITTA